MGRSVQETAGPLGNGEPHNNLPPYRAVYIQLRAKPDPVVAQEVAADRLATARKIGNTSFDGSGDITLAQMGAMASSGWIYSTFNEINTGKTWINGKKLYRKVFVVIDTYPQSDYKTYVQLSELSNVDNVWDVKAFRLSTEEEGGGGGTIVIPHMQNGCFFTIQFIKNRGIEIFRTSVSMQSDA